MSQPEVAVRAMPDAVAMPPSRPPRTVPADGHQTRPRALAVRGDAGTDVGCAITSTPWSGSGRCSSVALLSAGRGDPGSDVAPGITSTGSGEDEVVVGVGEQLVAVRDGDDDAALGELGDDSGHVLGALGVEVRGRLVEEQQRLGREPGPGEGQPLALAGGQAEAVVTEVGGQPTGEGRDDAVDLDRAQGLPQLVVGGRVARSSGPIAPTPSRGTAAASRSARPAPRRSRSRGCGGRRAGRAASTCRRPTGRSRP